MLYNFDADSIITQETQISQRDRVAGCVSLGQKWDWETIFCGHLRPL